MHRWLVQLVVAASAAWMASFSPAVTAQDFPTRSIRFLVISSPGANSDLLTRIVAGGMSKALGQAVPVENMPGANGHLAQGTLARQPGDGYTILMTCTNCVTPQVFLKAPGYDVRNDLTPVSYVAESPFYFVSSVQAPWKTFGEMVAYAKANPGKINVGQSGVGDVLYLYMQAIKQRYGLEIVDVPYKAGSVAIAQALGKNEVQLGFSSQPLTGQMLRNNQIRLLLAGGDKRHAPFPDLPSAAEAGVPVIENIGFMVFAPRGVAKPVVDKLNHAIAETLKSPESSAQASKLGFNVIASTPEEMARRVAAITERISTTAAAAGMKPQ